MKESCLDEHNYMPVQLISGYTVALCTRCAEQVLVTVRVPEGGYLRG